MCVESASMAVNNTVSIVADALGLKIYGRYPSDRRDNLIEQLRSYSSLNTVSRVADALGLKICDKTTTDKMDNLIEQLKSLIRDEGEEKGVVDLLLKDAENEDGEAMYSLGRIYENGECGVDKNYGEAKKWYAKAAESGHVEAMYCLGKIYENGYGVEKNYFEAQKWYCEAAQSEHVEAMNKHIEMIKILFDNDPYDETEGIPEDFWSDDTWQDYRHDIWYDLEAMAEDGHVKAMEAVFILSKSHERLSSHLLWKAAKKGHIKAMYWLGIHSATEYDDAIYWLEKASDMGNVDAMYHLGITYKKHHHNRKAVYWLEKAANNGRIEAMYTLGSLTYENELTDKAVYWLEEAANNGHYEAMFDLGISAYEKYMKFRDNTDCNEAVRWLRRGAEGVKTNLQLQHKDRELQCKLGTIFYMNGSFSNAFYWFEKADVSGYTGLYLGLMYYNGCGVGRNLTKAKIWLEKALLGYDYSPKLNLRNFGNLLSDDDYDDYDDSSGTYHQDREGIMYLLGKICEEEGDDDKAKEWYHNAEQLQENLYCSYEPHYLGEFWK